MPTAGYGGFTSPTGCTPRMSCRPSSSCSCRSKSPSPKRSPSRPARELSAQNTRRREVKTFLFYQNHSPKLTPFYTKLAPQKKKNKTVDCHCAPSKQTKNLISHFACH
uniref:(northern house mosquito) hypothetical protein n=1 Tax=Culex pipiens TaxID=7175 RepID=A0A8D8AYD9_CULPI